VIRSRRNRLGLAGSGSVTGWPTAQGKAADAGGKGAEDRDIVTAGLAGKRGVAVVEADSEEVRDAVAVGNGALVSSGKPPKPPAFQPTLLVAHAAVNPFPPKIPDPP
jgi:hypothetical protein